MLTDTKDYILSIYIIYKSVLTLYYCMLKYFWGKKVINSMKTYNEMSKFWTKYLIFLEPVCACINIMMNNPTHEMSHLKALI